MEERWWRTDGAVVYGAGSSCERRSFAREVAGGGVSALVPAPLIRLGCFRRKHMRTQRCEKAVKGPIPQEIKGLPGLLFRERSKASSKEAKSG
jgi:hypothetical protein